MLQKVEVFNLNQPPWLASGGPGPADTDLTLYIEDAMTEALQVRDIQGIGPVKANINTTPFGSRDGDIYSSSNVGKRNIVLTIGLNPDWADQSITSLREQLYYYFMPKSHIRMRFTSTHIPMVYIDGYVESFEPNMFSKDPEIQISIICPKPNFWAAALTELYSLDTVDLTPSLPEFEVVEYEGTVPTGFRIGITDGASDYEGEYIVINNSTEQEFTVEADIDATHSFYMSSIEGEKYARQYVGISYDSALNAVTADSVWPVLIPGTNYLAVKAATPGQIWSYVYRAQFGGL